MKLLSLTLAGTVILASAGASAATCSEAVDRFANQHQLTAGMPDRPQDRSSGPMTAPATMESRGMSATDKMAATGGVITPPDTGSAAVIAPPATADKMQTAPAVQPSAPAGPAATQPMEIDAAKRAQAEAMLLAARNASRDGKEEQCFERLGQAQKLVQPGS